MASRRNNMGQNPFDRDGESLDRLDSELFGDLERVGRPVVLRLDEIRLDGGTQPRAELNWTVIGEYAEAIQGGAVFPPVDVFYDGSNYWLADGFHRWHGHDQASKDTIRAVIHQGSQRDAVLYSVGVNAEHGLRRTNEDKRRAVMRLLNDPEWSQWSDREIARQAKVSNRFVGNLRKSLTVNGSQIDGDSGEPETRKVRRGDTVYEQRVSADKRQEVAKQRAQEAQEPPSSAESEPVGQFEDAAEEPALNELKARIIAALAEWGELSPNKLRQATRADYTAYNTAITELLAAGAIEQVKDVQSGRVVYRLPDDAEQQADVPPAGVTYVTPDEHGHESDAAREAVLAHLRQAIDLLGKMDEAELAAGLYDWHLHLVERWGIDAEG